jgi:glycosyltransferase involved in cell wall biosynthesis
MKEAAGRDRDLLDIKDQCSSGVPDKEDLPTRIFEYLAMSKPVIAPPTQGIADYFKDDEIIYFEPENADDLAREMEWVYQHPAETRSVVERGRKVYEKYSWGAGTKPLDRLGQWVGAEAGCRGRPRLGKPSIPNASA